MTEKRTKTNDAKLVVSREFTIDDSACGVISACRNGKGNVLSVLMIPGFERLDQPLQKGDRTVIEIKKGESIRVKMTVTHSDDNKGPQDFCCICYYGILRREMLVLPQIYYIIVAELELRIAFYVYRKCYR